MGSPTILTTTIVAAPREDALWTTSFLRLLGAGSAYGFAFSSFHLMPKFMAVELAASPSQIGWQAGAFGVASLLTCLVVGSCIDRVSRRAMFGASSVLLAASAIGFAWIDAVGPALYLLRTLQGVAFTMQMASYSTLVAEMAPARRMGEAVGMAGASMLVMNAVAPAIDEPLARLAGWPATFLLAAVAAAIAAVMVLDGSPVRRGGAAGGAALLRVWRRPATRTYAWVTLLTAIAFAAMFTFLQPAALLAGYRDVGSFFVAYAAAAVAVRLLCGWMPDRYGRRRVAMLALVPYALVVAWVAVAGPTSLIGIGLVFGLAHGVFFPALNALAIEYTAPAERGRVLTIFAGAFNLGAWGGAAALGPVAEMAGYSWVFAIGALCAAVALAVLVRGEGLQEVSNGSTR